MGKERYCKICKRQLNKQNPGSLCIICQDKVAKTYSEKQYYDIDDIKHILGLESSEQVKRLGRVGKIPGRIPGIKEHRYLKREIDRWLESDHIFSQVSPRPVGPLQEEAYLLCQQGDHSWMREDRFIGHACTSETSAEIIGHSMPMQITYTCYFCKHEETML